MKVIDLLNKIANKEELPTFIKVRDSIFGVSYKFDGKDLDYQLGNEEYYLSDYICKGGISLNDEVEIIEEDKKIKKVHECFTSTDNKEIQFLIDNINQLGNKINEIIDYINGGTNGE